MPLNYRTDENTEALKKLVYECVDEVCERQFDIVGHGSAGGRINQFTAEAAFPASLDLLKLIKTLPKMEAVTIRRNKLSIKGEINGVPYDLLIVL